MAITISEDTGQPNLYGINKVIFTWVSDTAGTTTGTTNFKYSGLLSRVIFDPDAGDTQPTDAYDAVLNDADGYDLLHGNGSNLSNAANVLVDSSDGLGTVLGSKLTMTVSNAGDTNGGVMIVYIVRHGLA